MDSVVVPDPHMQGLFQKQFMQQQRQRQLQVSTFNPNRLPLSGTSTTCQQSSQQQDPGQTEVQSQLLHQQHQPSQHGHQQLHEKPVSGPGRQGGPALSLDTSVECLQSIKVIQLGNKSYLKLFSPSLVESPVSFLNHKQLIEDKQLWENGPNEAFQKQLDMEKREAFRARSKQQLRGFLMGLWLGCLMGILMLQQTSTKIHFWRSDMSSFSSLVILLIIASCVAIVRSGTRCTMTAVATCSAVLTCFATLIVNQSRYSTNFHLYKRAPPASV